MGHEFEVQKEIAIDATPEQVWEAIATGPGFDSWFMGHSEVQGREGGRMSFSLLGQRQESTVTHWEPGKRLAYHGDRNADGTFMAFEYLIEGRDGGSTLLPFVHSGILGGDWQAEYDALKQGNGMYLLKLAEYLEHFPGKTSTYNMFLPGPQVSDPERAWDVLKSALCLTETVTAGDPVHLEVHGLEPDDGVVAFVSQPSFLGARTGKGLYMLIQVYGNTVVEYHSFADDAVTQSFEQAWQDWLQRSLT
ncbi:MAG: SRPBCC domain-containing protein [Nocardioidaceae bacterium]